MVCDGHDCGDHTCGGHDHGEDIVDIVREYREKYGASCRLFENPEFQELFQGAIRPGGLTLTKEAFKLAGLGSGSKILDVGCGSGETVAYLANSQKSEAVGIDLSDVLIEKAREKFPDLRFEFGDGVMIDFPSASFDGVFIECTLSQMDNVVEALHEAFCVLKNGGKLVISDFYRKEGMVDPGDENSFFKKAFDKEKLLEAVEDIGFEIRLWEERNRELKEFTASLIMHYGSLENFYKTTEEVAGESPFRGIGEDKKLGYFLLIAEKK